MTRPRSGPPEPTSAFLLTQLGTHAAGLFAQRVAEIELTPPQCGVLGILGSRAGMSQQELADTLRMIPSRVVPLVDGLEEAGLVTRVRDQVDRRRNALRLTERGRAKLILIGRVARAHDEAVTTALTAAERRQLHELLQRVADDQGLTRGVHPGYRSLNPAGDEPSSTRSPAAKSPVKSPAAKPPAKSSARRGAAV